jgi:epoxyqueuosine reductase
MPTRLLQQLEQSGYRAGIVSAQRMANLQEGIDAQHRTGLLDEELYDRYLSSLDFEPPETLHENKSIIVVAVPDPQRRIIFTWEGQSVPVTVPPTYLHWRQVDERVEEALAEIVGERGFHVALANLPKKLTAVRSGLAVYGRNNVTYVPGMGSLYRLVVFWSDLPIEEDNWQELRALDACEKCEACRRACPTAAIPSDRFLVRAERCLTFFNEKPAEVPFPDWLDPSWHNCLVGCMRCQRVCPENRERKDWIEGDEGFTEEETALLLDGVGQEHLPPETAEKLGRLDLIELLDIIPRNLKALLSA